MPGGVTDDAVVEWVARGLGLEASAHRGVRGALSDCSAASPSPVSSWGLEMHHDGTAHVDMCAVVHAGVGRRVAIAGAPLLIGPEEYWEYDLDGDAPRLAGIFRHVEESADAGGWVDEATERLGTPVLVGHLTGRRNQVRYLVDVVGELGWERASAVLGEVNAVVAPSVLRARSLLGDSTRVRIGLELEPDGRRLGTRLGLEIFDYPGVDEPLPFLEALNVSAASIAEMVALHRRVPFGRERWRCIEGLPGMELDRMVDAVTVSHLSVSWTGSDPILKSYLLVTSTPWVLSSSPSC